MGADFIIDIGLCDRTYAKIFFDRLDFGDNTVIKFFLTCSDEAEWKRRHMQRLENPLPHQSFKSYEHVVEHYGRQDINPFDDEYVIDSAKPIKQCFYEIECIIDNIDT